MPVECICIQCGLQFFIKPSGPKRGRGKFCSRLCQGKYHFAGERNPKYKAAVKSVFCLQCNKMFGVYASRIKNGGGKFCSYFCKFKFENSGEKNHNWKGGKFAADGYMALSGYGRKRLYKHTFVAEAVLGRRLKGGEVVHHINGNKGDNRNCNLIICEKSYHHWLHHRMAKLYQQEHFSYF